MKSDDLHQLIHSLSKNEKRYVSQFSKLHEKNGQNQYKEIFNLLSKIPPSDYDESEFRSVHSNKAWQKHFPQKKKYLKDLILTAMRLYHRTGKVQSEIEDMLRDQAFLHERGIYESSQRLLNRAKKLALGNDCTRLLAEINERERKLLLERQSKGVIEELGRSIDESRSVREMVEKEIRRRELYERCFAEYRFGKKSDRDRSIEYFGEAIENEESLSEPNDSFKARLDLLASKAVHARMRSQFEEFHQTYREILALWEASERMQKEEPKRFIKAIANYANSCHSLGLIPELEGQLEKLEEFEAKDFECEAERFQNLVHLKLLYFLNTHQLEKAVNLVEEKTKQGIEMGLAYYGPKVNAARRRTIAYNCFVLYFILEDYRVANSWIQKVFDYSIGEARSDLKALSLILFPMFWYDRGDFDLFENHLRSAKYSVKDAKEAAPNQLEMIMVEFLNKLKSKNGDSQIVEYAKWAKKELRRIYSGEQDERIPLGIDEFNLWLDSKINHKPIREIFEDS